MSIKLKMLALKLSIGLLTSAVIGMIVKEEIKVLDDAEEKLKEKKKQRDAETES